MKLIEIGQVVNTHGVRGEFKLNPWTDSLDGLLDYDVFYYQKKGQDVPLYGERIIIHKNCAIIKAEGVDTMEEAELLRGQTLFVERDENLPEGRYYIVDLIGLRVMTEEDEVLGIISDVLQTGANDVYEVRGNEKPIYLPVIDQVVLEVNIPEGYVRVAVPEGLLD